MKILYLTTTLGQYPGDSRGGAGNSWFDFFMKMSESCDITVLAPRVTGAKKEEEIGTFKIIRIDPVKPALSLENMMHTADFWKIPLLCFNMWRAANALLRRSEYDLIHSFWAIPSGFLGSLTRSQIPKVVTCLGSDIHTWSYKPVAKQVVSYTLKNAESVVCVSKQMCRRVEELGVDNIEYIPTPVDTSSFTLYDRYEEKHSIVSASRLTPQKGLHVLLDAIKIAKVHVPNIKLYLCGDGLQRKSLEKQAQSLNIEENVVFLGFVSRDKLIEVLKISKAFVLPSLAEGMPSSIVEAFAVGRPVISTDVGDLKELVTPDLGEVVSSKNAGQFAAAIVHVLNRDFNTYKLREKAEEFDTKQIMQRYLRIYTYLCRK